MICLGVLAVAITWIHLLRLPMVGPGADRFHHQQFMLVFHSSNSRMGRQRPRLPLYIIRCHHLPRSLRRSMDLLRWLTRIRHHSRFKHLPGLHLEMRVIANLRRVYACFGGLVWVYAWSLRFVLLVEVIRRCRGADVRDVQGGDSDVNGLSIREGGALGVWLRGICSRASTRKRIYASIRLGLRCAQARPRLPIAPGDMDKPIEKTSR